MCLYISLPHWVRNDVSSPFNMENTVSCICPGSLNHPACQKQQSHPSPARRALFLLRRCPPCLLPARFLHGCTVNWAAEAKLLRGKTISFHPDPNAGHRAITQSCASAKAGEEQGLIRAAERRGSLEVLF